MCAAYFLRAVATSASPRITPECPTIAFRALPDEVGAAGEELYPWMLDILSQGWEFGLYIAEFSTVDEEGEGDVCFREELLLWDGNRGLLRETRNLNAACPQTLL